MDSSTAHQVISSTADAVQLPAGVIHRHSTFYKARLHLLTGWRLGDSGGLCAEEHAQTVNMV